MKLRAYPVVRILLFFLIGLLGPAFPVFYLYLGLCTLFLITLIGHKYKVRTAYTLSTWLIILILGSLLQVFEEDKNQTAVSVLEAESYVAQVISKPEAKPKSYKAVAKVIKVLKHDSWQPSKEKVLMYFNRETKPDFETVYLLHKPPREIEGPKNPEEFDYKLFQKRKGIHAHHFLREGDYSLLGKKDLRWHLQLAYTMNEYANEVFRRYIKGPDEIAVAQAMVIGQKDDLSQNLRQSYATAGAVHILAVSGLHVGILFLLFGFILSWLKKLPKGIYWFGFGVISCLWVYALFTGFSPSVTRATLMFSIIQIGLITRQEKNSINTIAFSALVLLIVKPNWIYEVGFQLSYMAILGIVILFPYLNAMWQPKNWLLSKLWQISIVSISAQLFTFPLSVYYFHQFPNYFLLTNPIVTILSTVILFAGVGLLMISWIPFLNEILGWVLNKSLWLLNQSVAWIEKLPNSKGSGFYWDRFEVLCLYAAIFLAIMFFLKKLPAYFKLTVVSLLCFFAYNFSQWWFLKDQQKLVFHYVPNKVAISYIDHNRVTLYADSLTLSDERAYGFHFSNYYDASGIKQLHKSTIENNQPMTLNIGNEKVLWLKSYSKGTVEDPFDKVLISNNAIYDITQKFISLPRHIILDASNNAWRVRKLKEDCKKLKIKCTSLYEHGALVVDLKE